MSNVTFKRSPNVNSIPIVDGQLIFDETNNKIYMDNGEQRIQYGGDVALISSVDYATANNAFSALATTELFLNKNTVVDSKTDALAATEQGLPVGCLAFQSAIGQADYSSIDNTISACLLTLDDRFKANNNILYMDYHDGRYGYNTSSTRGADTFHPFNNILDLGTDSSFSYDLKQLPNYQGITVDDVIVAIEGQQGLTGFAFVQDIGSFASSGSLRVNKNIDSNYILSVTAQSYFSGYAYQSSWSSGWNNINIHVYIKLH